YCGGYSYSAATAYDHWACPYCRKDLTGSPECDRPLRVIDGRGGQDGPGPGATLSDQTGPADRTRRVVSMTRRPPNRPRRLRLI
ncbi:MAG: hypothetical protein ACYC53_08785, partial [Bacillota bacterium]